MSIYIQNLIYIHFMSTVWKKENLGQIKKFNATNFAQLNLIL